ncbi:hypothetical protein [Thalassospira sp. TSL5-1]|uniref:hypothetical protein n=1 Tax=Thalassospira sp. TSL5-1 TaxID=1544451 RepID=UPI00093AD5AB|nr:hypothetical protein [Thalassospira sp. TSL5-1]OKH89232.1 hypothetical protein LF95_04205 [Thalassospira sp. TSL5-1]
MQKFAIVPVGRSGEIKTDNIEIANGCGFGYSAFVNIGCGKISRGQIREMARARHDSMRENIKGIFGPCFSQAWNELDNDTIKLNIKDMTAAVKAIGLDVEDNDEETV